MKKTSTSILILTIFIMVVIFTLSSCSTCNHVWNEATCTEPKTCQLCGAVEGSAKGHSEEWIVTKEPTLVSTGEEELMCIRCKKSSDKQTLDKKIPRVENDHFNFTDEEFLQWLDYNSTMKVGYTNLGAYDDDQPNTSYSIEVNGNKGILLLNHGSEDKNAKVKAVMVAFDNRTSCTTGVWIGNKIDPNFDSDDAINQLLTGKLYQAANMTGVISKQANGLYIYLLAPTEYYNDL